MNDFLNFGAARTVQFSKTYVYMCFHSTNSNKKGITRYDAVRLWSAPRVKKKKIGPKCSDFCRVQLFMKSNF